MAQDREARSDFIAQAAKFAIEKYKRGAEDAPSTREFVELLLILERHFNRRNQKGNVKNLRNQKPKKITDLG